MTNAAETKTQLPASEWRGFIDNSIGELNLIVRLEQSATGQWSGSADIPNEGVVNSPLHDLVVDISGISFSLTAQAQVSLFQGTFVNEGEQITGRVKNGPVTLPFKLVRGSAQLSINNAVMPAITLANVNGLPSERASLAGPDHPAIQYSTQPTTDVVANLNRKLQDGEIQLKFNSAEGYLGSVLDALNIAVDTQMLVFSKTSVQAPRINPANPRALFFRDDVVVGFIRNAPFLEFAAHDPQQGIVFYILDQRDTAQPRLVRRDSCLNCHITRNSMDIPGLLLRSVVTGIDGRTFDQFGSYHTDDRSPWDQRWGGWYVTGSVGGARHMGNAMLKDVSKPEELVAKQPLALTSLAGRFDATGYPSLYSDVAALLVFEHQAHMSNLLIRIGWDTRAVLQQALPTSSDSEVVRRLLANDAREVVDYLLFVDEAPIAGEIKPSSTFAGTFAAQGPFDSKGRTLRQLDLRRRLMRYRCSYMIYSAAFDALPDPAREAIYQRMWQILSGKEKDARYQKFSANDRRAIVDILRETKQGLPTYFK